MVKKSLIVLVITLATFSTNSWAGNQKEEALADAVKVALLQAVSDTAPPRPSFTKITDRLSYLNWLADASSQLKKKIPHTRLRQELLQTIWYEAKRAGLDPAMVLGLIEVESGFRKYAISTAGARGLMQIMPFWTRVVGDNQPQKLFHLHTNLRYGCAILRMYLDMEAGNLFLALGRYNGSRGQATYPNQVLSAWKKWRSGL